jgi:hypothetical protein
MITQAAPLAQFLKTGYGVGLFSCRPWPDAPGVLPETVHSPAGQQPLAGAYMGQRAWLEPLR